MWECGGIPLCTVHCHWNIKWCSKFALSGWAKDTRHNWEHKTIPEEPKMLLQPWSQVRLDMCLCPCGWLEWEESVFPGLEGKGFAHQWRAATCFLWEAPGADSSDWDESLREAGDFVLLCSLQNLTLSYFHSSFAMSATPLVKWWDCCWLLQGEHPEVKLNFGEEDSVTLGKPQWSRANLASKAAEVFLKGLWRCSPRIHLFMCHAVLTISFHFSVAISGPTQLQIRTVS